MSTHLLLTHVFLLSVSVGVCRVHAGNETSENVPNYATFNNSTNSDDVSVEYCSMDDFYCPGHCATYTKVSLQCSCHPACSLFGDCCYDSEEFYNRCQNSSNFQLTPSLDSVGPYQDFFHCIRNKYMNFQTYWMISECPSSWQGPDLCKGHVPDSTLFNQSENHLQLADIPVLSKKGLTFKNVFCAACHSVSEGNLLPWEIWAACPLNQKYLNFSFLSFVEKVSFFNQECSEIELRPPSQADPATVVLTLPCYEKPGGSIATCHNDVTDEELARNCSKILAPIEVKGVKFKNKFCFRCSSLARQNVPLVDICSKNDNYNLPAHPRLSSLSIMLNFGNRFETDTVTCEDGFVYDPFRSKCISLVCWEGFELKNEICTRISGNDNSDDTCDLFSFNVSISFDSESNFTCKETKEVWVSINSVLFDAESSSLFATYCFQSSQGRELTFQITPFSPIKFFEKMTAARNVSLCKNCKFMKNLTVVGFCPKMEYECTYVAEWEKESRWKSGENLAYDNLINGNLKFKYSFQRDSFQNVSESMFFQRCKRWSEYLLNCSFVQMNASLFRPFIEGSKELVYTLNESVRLTHDMYRYTSVGEITVCNIFSPTGHARNLVAFFPYSFLQGVFSTVGTVLSISSLAVCLITYSIFPTLRGQSGNIIVMVLFVNLMCAQICLVLCRLPDIASLTCTVIAVFGHFFWLSTFNTTTLFGFKLLRTFKLRCTKRENPVSMKKFLKNIAMCFTVPVVFCSSLLLLKAVNLIHIEYGYGTSCWIGGPEVNIYAFGVPGGIYLLMNIGCFVKLTLSICTQQKKRRQLRPVYSRPKIQEFLIHVKIFFILGISWIFGFLAAFTHVDFLWYIFIILTSFQGFFIFLAFICKPRILKLWLMFLGAQLQS